jgi:hypothetical protein
LSSVSESVDLVLLIRESAVVKSRDRSIEFIIKSLSQANLLKSSDQEINSQEEAFTQRNSSQFEIIENIVTERQTVSVRERVDNRERERERERDARRARRERRDDKTKLRSEEN